MATVSPAKSLSCFGWLSRMSDRSTPMRSLETWASYSILTLGRRGLSRPLVVLDGEHGVRRRVGVLPELDNELGGRGLARRLEDDQRVLLPKDPEELVE